MSITDKELRTRIHSALDAVQVPETPWATVRPMLRRPRRRHRGTAAMASAAVVAIAAVGSLVAVHVGSGTTRNATAPSAGAGRSGTAAVRPPQSQSSLQESSHFAAMVAQPGFLVYIASSNFDTSVPSARAASIAAGDAGSAPARNSLALVKPASPNGYWAPSANAARTKIAYVVGAPAHLEANDGEGNIVIAKIDGSSPRTVTTRGASTDPVWSPDGTQIAYLRNESIWLMSASGSGQHQLPVALGAVHSISWSPDGKELAVSVGDSPERIAIVKISSDTFRWFTPATGVEQYDPSWSPSGRQLVYGQTGPNALFVSNINGSGVRQLTTCRPPSCTQDVEPAWSPDGKQIAFVQSDYGATEIYVVSAAGGKPTAVTSGPEQYMMPSW